MKKSRIVQINERELEIVDVSDDVEICNENLVFDKINFSKVEVEKLIKMKVNDLKRFEKRYEHFKTLNFELESSFESYLDEEKNEILDDLDYLVTSLTLLDYEF